ncbi:MAG: hypothetical protein FJ335_00765 [Sphingomonadales bacterium]|nr:hypothetical protein [Sphingomonadales bacterium]
MVFDLGKAMRSKEEFESRRLLDFEFRRRARATRMAARSLGIDDADAAGIAPVYDEDAIPARLADISGHALADVATLFSDRLRQAHEQLIVECGDPTPHRLG